MKRIVNNILFSATLLLLAACSSEVVMPEAPVCPEKSNRIILMLSAGKMPATRAEATGAELTVNWIDVLVFDSRTVDGVVEPLKYHERVTTGNTSGQGTITLAQPRDFFDENVEYWVYLIANSSKESSMFEKENLPDRNALFSMTQFDSDIHLTGLSGAKSAFLMDGVAYLANTDGATEPASPAAVELNDPDTEETKLKVTLRRAAAKIKITLLKGDNISVTRTGTYNGQTVNATLEYYVGHLPNETYLVDNGMKVTTPSEDNKSDKTNTVVEWLEDTHRTTSRLTTVSETVNGTSTVTEVSVTAYAYAHNWSNATLGEETRIVINLPITYNNGTAAEYKPYNWYQIPISRQSTLERNTYYEIVATVNTPGGINPTAGTELKDINYNVLEWISEEISVGGTTSDTQFLYVNESELDMANIAEDSKTLVFSSSSRVTATITSVYYYDRLGVKQSFTKGSGDTWTSTVTQGNKTYTETAEISVTPVGNFSGNIKVNSTIPTNQTARYIEIAVTNEDTDITRKVTVTQYPLEYITNILSWYSYRSDFNANYENHPSTGYYAAKWNNGKWEYGTKVLMRLSDEWFATSGAYTFRSHVVNSTDKNGYSLIYAYGYSTGNSSVFSGIGSYNSPGSYQTLSGITLNNAHMYNVQITSSSGDYILSKPELDANGYTLHDDANKMRVSPSFMIASQLGQVMPVSSKDIAASHCKQYAEAYKNESGTTVHLDDWRLPTQKELEVIENFQNDSPAMDIVLAGTLYWTADGQTSTEGGTVDPVKDGKGPTGSAYIRCIRDAN